MRRPALHRRSRIQRQYRYVLSGMYQRLGSTVHDSEADKPRSYRPASRDYLLRGTRRNPEWLPRRHKP